MTYLIPFIVAFLVSAGLMPSIISWARKRGHFDPVGERKIHTGEVPRLGGVGIYLGFFVSSVVALAIAGFLYPAVRFTISFWILLLGGLGFHVLGLVDDFLSLRARFKFLVQLLLAFAVLTAGYSIKYIELPFAPFRLELGFMAAPITLLWIIGMSNALNLIDGVDGLAGGAAFIGIGFWAAISYKSGAHVTGIVATAVCGAILGFLFYNFPRASIFMGDSGSLFLGFMLAVIPLVRAGDGLPQSGLLAAMTISLIPIFDTFAAIIRRTRAGVSFFTADKSHTHHKLMNLGFSTRQILAILYFLCLAIGATVFIGLYTTPTLAFILMASAWVVCAGIFVLLHVLKERNVTLIRRTAIVGRMEAEAAQKSHANDESDCG